MEVIPSNKGGQKCLLYVYKITTRKNHIWWSCVQGRSLHCKGSLKTSLAMDTPVSGASHNHDPDRGSVCVTKAKANLKSLAAQTREKPGHLFPQTLADLPDYAKRRLGKQDTIKKMIRRTRGSRHLSVPDSLTSTVNGFRLYKMNLKHS